MVVRSFCSLRVSCGSPQFCSRELFWLGRVEGRLRPQAAMGNRRTRSRDRDGAGVSALDGADRPEGLSAFLADGIADPGQSCLLAAASAIDAKPTRCGSSDGAEPCQFASNRMDYFRRVGPAGWIRGPSEPNCPAGAQPVL